jgi:hypothetical protein
MTAPDVNTRGRKEVPMSSLHHFSLQDLSPPLPTPGFYSATISHAGFRRSSRGHRMLYVLFRLEGVSPAFQSMADYFVLEGATTNGIAVARRRLVSLYHACGFHPEEGEEILPGQLIDSRVQLKVDHVEWENQSRLRVLSYRSAWSPAPTPF